MTQVCNRQETCFVNNDELKHDHQEVSDRLLANEVACDRAVKGQRQLRKRVQTLADSTEHNNVSLMRAQQTLGERLRLLEDGVAASNSERMGKVNELRARLEELKRNVDAVTASLATNQCAPSAAASVDSHLQELVGRHEFFLNFYGPRIVATTLALS